MADRESESTSSCAATAEKRSGAQLGEQNAAVLALKQNLDALILKRDRANEELDTMQRRRELLLHEIDRSSQGIAEIVEALHKLDEGHER